MNKVTYKYRGKESQEAPRFWSCQFEVVEGCNSNCLYCGLHSIRDKGRDWSTYKYMDLGMIQEICKQLNQIAPQVRIEINTHGEPLLHPEIINIAKIIRRAIPQSSIQLQTNGMKLWNSNLGDVLNNFIELSRKLFYAGLNMFVVDAYHEPMYKKLTENRSIIEDESYCTYHDTFRDPGISFNHYHRHSGRHFVVVDDLVRASKDPKIKVPMSKLILNEGGNTPESFMKAHGLKIIKAPLEKACSRVFREITFGYQGLVPACCYMWRNELIMGKFPEMTINEIWNSDTAHAMRYLMSNEVKCREFSSCDRCNYEGGGRIGLISKVQYEGGYRKAMLDLYRGMKKWTNFQYPNLDHHVGCRIYNKKKNISLTEWNKLT